MKCGQIADMNKHLDAYEWNIRNLHFWTKDLHLREAMIFGLIELYLYGEHKCPRS